MRRWNRQGRTAKLRWDDEHHLRVGNARFLLTLDPTTWESNDSGPNQFVLLKNKGMLESLVRFAPEHVGNIVDLGIYKGGSVALLEELFAPRHLVGIDWLSDRVDILDEFIAHHGLSNSVSLYYDTDQGNRERLIEIVKQNFGDDPIDMVIDDCSHLYEQTKASLNVLLPCVRPGGLYVIEDWGWAHWPDEYWQGSEHSFVDEEAPLSRLILELVMVVASRPGLIERLSLSSGVVYLTRGSEDISEVDFDISKSYATAGREMLADQTASELPPS